MNGGNGEQYPEISTPIVFTANQQEDETVTRAEALENYATTFTVYGYKNMSYESENGYGDLQTVFPGYTVNWTANSAYTTTTNTDGWEYVNQQLSGEEEQTIKYWDWSAKAYRFFGYTLGTATADPATDPATVTVATAATTVAFSSTVDASSQATIDAAPYFSRLWFSDGNAAIYPDRQFGKPVQLQFLKPFARVRFMFTFVEGLSFGREKLKNISFHPTATQGSSETPTIATAGDVSVTYPLTGTQTTETWTTSPTTGIEALTIDYYKEPDPAVTPEDNQPTTWPNTPRNWYTVLPALTQDSYTLEVAVVTDEKKTAVVPAEYMSWKPGYEYTYIFKITEGGSIELNSVNAAFTPWKTDKTAEHSVYNW